MPLLPYDSINESKNLVVQFQKVGISAKILTSLCSHARKDIAVIIANTVSYKELKNIIQALILKKSIGIKGQSVAFAPIQRLAGILNNDPEIIKEYLNESSTTSSTQELSSYGDFFSKILQRHLFSLTTKCSDNTPKASTAAGLWKTAPSASSSSIKKVNSSSASKANATEQNPLTNLTNSI